MHGWALNNCQITIVLSQPFGVMLIPTRKMIRIENEWECEESTSKVKNEFYQTKDNKWVKQNSCTLSRRTYKHSLLAMCAGCRCVVKLFDLVVFRRNTCNTSDEDAYESIPQQEFSFARPHSLSSQSELDDSYHISMYSSIVSSKG